MRLRGPWFRFQERVRAFVEVEVEVVEFVEFVEVVEVVAVRVGYVELVELEVALVVVVVATSQVEGTMSPHAQQWLGSGSGKGRLSHHRGG